jgi:hypothetical protein
MYRMIGLPLALGAVQSILREHASAEVTTLVTGSGTEVRLTMSVGENGDDSELQLLRARTRKLYDLLPSSFATVWLVSSPEEIWTNVPSPS